MTTFAIVCGMSGAGGTTTAKAVEELAKEHGYSCKVVEIGALLGAAGKAADGAMATDAAVHKILQKQLGELREQGTTLAVIDGWPRTAEQLLQLTDLLRMGQVMAVTLAVDPTVAAARMLKRQRVDDTPTIIREKQKRERTQAVGAMLHRMVDAVSFNASLPDAPDQVAQYVVGRLHRPTTPTKQEGQTRPHPPTPGITLLGGTMGGGKSAYVLDLHMAHDAKLLSTTGWNIASRAPSLRPQPAIFAPTWSLAIMKMEGISATHSGGVIAVDEAHLLGKY